MKRFGIVSLIIGLLLTSSVFVVAQTEPDASIGRLIERPYTAVVTIREDGTDWAGEIPFSGETSDFDGRCSVPSDWVFHMRWEGLDSIFGRFTGTASHCAQVTWGINAEGTPMMTGIVFTDGVFVTTWAGGSTLGGKSIDMGMGIDAETGLITYGNVQYSVGEGTGQLAGATMFHISSCHYGSDEAVIAGLESILCTSHGTIRYDPFAGIDQ